MLVITTRLCRSLLWAHKSSKDTLRQNLNQSQNDQKIPLTTFTTATHSHVQNLVTCQYCIFPVHGLFFPCTISHDVGWVPILHASNEHKYIRAVLNEDYVAEVVQGPSIMSRQNCSCVRITDMYTSLTLSPSPYN